MLLLILYFVVIPVVIFGALFISRDKSFYLVARDIGLGLTSIILLVFVLRWDLASTSIRWLVIPFFCLTALFAYRSHLRRFVQEAQDLSWQRKLKACIFAILIPATTFAIFMVRLDGEQAPVALNWPLEPGKYFIAQGGSSEWLNHHNSVNAQKFAIDITGLDGFSRHSTSLMPADLDKYYINGVQIVSPCDGQVVALGTGWGTLNPSMSKRTNPAGNYLAIFCEQHTVLLAHFSEIFDLEIDQIVTSGDALGRVGNTGNSTEPHLHIHAVTGRVSAYEDLMFSASGVPLVFDGRILRRNDIFKLSKVDG